jgi:hypothetical protein
MRNDIMMSKHQLVTQMLLTQWKKYVGNVNNVFNALTPEKYEMQVAPGSNTVSWILAHLTQVSDNLNPLLGLQDQLYPHLAFIVRNGTMPVHEAVSLDELFRMWRHIYVVLDDHFSAMSAEQWFERHMSVSEEDFKKEPHRNKLNVLISRTMHLNHHLGQLALIIK